MLLLLYQKSRKVYIKKTWTIKYLQKRDTHGAFVLTKELYPKLFTNYFCLNWSELKDVHNKIQPLFLSIFIYLNNFDGFKLSDWTACCVTRFLCRFHKWKQSTCWASRQVLCLLLLSVSMRKRDSQQLPCLPASSMSSWS